MWTSNRARTALAAIALAALPQLASAAVGDLVWNRGWDANGFADMDGAGATNAAGMFFGAINFGGGAQNSANPFSGDVFVARYDENGAFQWSRTFTPSMMGVTVTAVSSAPTGSIYIAGTFIGGAQIDFGGGALGGAGEMWIAKLDELGNHLWSDTFGIGIIHSLDANQNLLAIGGEFPVDIDFGGGVISSNGNNDAFIALIHGGGVHIWSAGFGDATQQITKDVHVDVSGTLVAAGCFQGAVDFGGGALMSNAIPDVFVAKFDPVGAHVWSKNFPGQFGTSADVEVAISQDDGAELVVLAGSVGNAAVDLGGGALAPLGGTDIYVAMLDELGNHEWSQRHGSGMDDHAQDVAFDSSGNALVSGTYNLMINFGSGVHVSNGASDLFISIWEPDGTHAWSRSYGTPNPDERCRVVTDPAANALLFGAADNFVNFGGGNLPDAEFYLARIKSLNPAVGAPELDSAAITADASSYPNPFRASTTIRLAGARAGQAAIVLCDVNGRRVRALDADASGIATWDGRDTTGRDVPPGVYFWRVAGTDDDSATSTGRVIRMR